MLCRKFQENFSPSTQEFKTSWKSISDEFNKEIQHLSCYKTEKQCKERWFNHLCPFLKKCYFFNNYIIKKRPFFLRESWSLEEDIKLLAESLKTPKKWSLIARKMRTRNCHQIKNRFITLLAEEMDCSRDKIREIINGNTLIGTISNILKKISKNSKKNKKIHEEAKNPKKEEESKEEDFEEFINFKKERPNFIFYD